MRYLILFIIVTILTSCGDDSAGGAGEVGNPIITVKVLDEDGAPIHEATTYCIPENFNPLRASAKIYLTGENGITQSDTLAQNDTKYRVLALSPAVDLAAQSPLFVPSEYTGDTLTLTLRKAASLTVKKTATEGDTAFIPGTPFYSTIEDEKGQFIFSVLPPDTLSPVTLQKGDITTALTKTIALESGEEQFSEPEYLWRAFTDSSLQDSNEIFYYLTFAENGDIWSAAWYNLIIYNKGDWIIRKNTDLGLRVEDKFFDLVTDKEGTIWIATSYGLLQYKNDNFTLISPEDLGFSNRFIQTLALGPDSLTLTIGGDGAIAELKNGSWITYSSETHAFPNATVISMTINPQGELLAGLLEKGMLLLQNGSISVHDSLRNQTISSIASDAIGRFWFTSEQKPYILDRGILVEGFPSFEEASITSVQGICREPITDHMWIYGRNGLYKTDFTQWTHYTEPHNLLNDDGVFSLTFTTINDEVIAAAGLHDGIIQFQKQ